MVRIKRKKRKGNDADQNEGIMVRAHRTLSPLSMPTGIFPE